MRITDVLGIELPIIQAPMAGVQGSALAIAVSNAGGRDHRPGGVARGIPNRLMRELGAINPAAPVFPLASAALAPLRAAAERAGSGDFSPLWAGQNTTRCTELPAARITRDLAGA